MIKTCCALMVLLLLVAGGCGDGGAAVLKRRSDLERLAIGYRDYHKLHHQSPADASDLLEWMSQSDDQGMEAVSAAEALREGDILMIWKGDLGASSDPKQYVLGFEAGVPAHGGYVVMADGTVQVMKRGEFSSVAMLPAGGK